MTVPKVRRKKSRRGLNNLRVLAYTGVISFCMFVAFYLHSKSSAGGTGTGTGTGNGAGNGAMMKKGSSQSIRGSGAVVSDSDSGSGDSASGSGDGVNEKTITTSDNTSSSNANKNPPPVAVKHADKSSSSGIMNSGTKDNNNNNNTNLNPTTRDDNENENLPKSVTFKTTEGDIRIKLRPDLSLPSVQYIQKLLNDPSPCSNCQFYRAEKPGILQGILRKKGITPNTVLGECPEEMKGKKHDCPAHDPNCGCHGPIMKRGMIGWAAGKGGPDFFIDSYKRPATWWNTDHTVFGEIADDESMEVVMGFYGLPATKKTLTMLDVPVHIELSTP